ncbi:MAG: undecaprenyldiphospho-muramoylpentapeptide beta-N-acetylglucosaminyltransferase [Myxococcales bacterium]|nr:undecaprenyldiphospho-muramoylpentapeptide beta-N-acetylglucosaminyltransferase [Myxococcales bacterium]
MSTSALLPEAPLCRVRPLAWEERAGATALALARDSGEYDGVPARTPEGMGARVEAGRGLRVLIAGGGTGGHLFPGIALAEEIRERGGEALFVGTERGIEARVLPRHGWPLETIEVVGIKGRGVLGLVRGLFKLPGAFFQSRAILRRFRPDVVIGVGGYASGPLVATAALLRVPTAIMEQNSIPGVTNRILGRVVRAVFTSFPDVGGHFPARKVVRAGNPIRRQLLERLDDAPRASDHPPRLFVFGGSQGAQAINQAVLEALPSVLTAIPELELWHQTGEAEHARVQSGYAALGLTPPRARVDSFIHDMAAPYRWADLVLCRAGATSVAELAAVARPAILIPFPHAADDHQEWNARALVDVGAAVRLRQSELGEGRLADALTALLSDRERLTSMQEAMRTVARPAAAADIYDGMAALLRR